MCPSLLKDALICVYPLARGYLPCFCNKCICYTTHVVGWGTVESLEGISFALAAPPAEDRIHQQGNKCISVTGVAYHRIWMKGLLMPHVSCLFQALARFTDKVYISSHLSLEALLLTRSQRYEGWTGTSALMRSPYVLSSQDLYDTYVTCSEDQRHFSAQSTSTLPLSAERNCCSLECLQRWQFSSRLTIICSHYFR